MSLLRSFPAAAFALVLVSIVAFCVATESFGLLVLGGALAAMSWYVTEGPRGRTLPRWASNLLLVAAVVASVLELSQGRGSAETMGILGRFSLWLTLIKLYERKGVRDYGHLLALSAVLMMAGCMQTVQLAFGVLLLIYALLGLYVVLLFQLHIGFERARSTRASTAPTAAALVPPVETSTGRRPVRQFRGLAVLTAMAGLLLSLVVFVIFPRDLLGTESVFASLARRQAGFGEDVRLNDSSRISESRREVFTVQLLDPRGTPIRYHEPLHLRGAVLDRYSRQDGRWTVSRQSQATTRTFTTEGPGVFVPLSALAVDDRVQTYTLEVRMRSLATDVVFTMYAPIALACDAGRTFTLEPATLVLRDRRTTQLGRYAAYAVRVQPFASEAAMSVLTGEARGPERPVVFQVEAARTEAERILRERGLDRTPPADADEAAVWRHRVGLARAFAEELQSGRYRYTTDLTDFIQLPGRDPIDLFLTEYRFGHCEHFASALAALCRSVGVDARLVTGFIGIDFDEGSATYVVRENNAHAWVEVRSGPHTWLTLDPTPPGELQSLNDANRNWADSWRWLWDRIEFMWNSRFVAFDSSSQAMLAERVNTGWVSRLRDTLGSVREWAASVNAFFRLGPSGYIWLGLVGLVVAVAIVAAVKLARRAIAIRQVARLERLSLAESRRLLRELGFYVDMLQVLGRAGLTKPAWQPPRAFALALAERRPDEGTMVRELVDRFYAARYGGRHLTADERRQAHARVDALAKQLRVR